MRALLVCLLLTLPVVSPSAHAQNHGQSADQDADTAEHTLEIREGKLWMDGRMMPEAVPDTMNLKGVTATIRYTGPMTPVLEIDGTPYVLEDGRLIPQRESSRAGQAVLYSESRSMATPLAPPPASFASDAARGESMPFQQAVRMGEEAYLRELSDDDRALYDKIQRDRRLDREAVQLAIRIRAMPRGPDREEVTEQLEKRLREGFALKLEIRREEVARARAEIDQVESLLNERAAMEDEVIEARLQELIGE